MILSLFLYGGIANAHHVVRSFYFLVEIKAKELG